MPISSASSEDEFDESAYLNANPDVADAVRRGQFRSGWHHFQQYGINEKRPCHTLEKPSSQMPYEPAVRNPILRFEQRAPSYQTAVDTFWDRWACDLQPLLGVSGTGPALLFTQDTRPSQAASVLGADGRFVGYNVLELGPLEAAHTYLLEQLGARTITAVEASVEAYLKCLVVKEILQLKKAKFLLGDIRRYLDTTLERFDLIFCSGVLYHMDEPVGLIRSICGLTDRCFVWTHYYDRRRHPVPFDPIQRIESGFSTTYWSHTYGDRSADFWGGNKNTAAWLERDSLLAGFQHFGLSRITIIDDDYDHTNGPAITFAAARE